MLRTSLRTLLSNRLAGTGALIIAAFVLLALAAPVLTRLHVLRAPDRQEDELNYAAARNSKSAN